LLAECSPFLATNLPIPVLVDLGEGRHALLSLAPRAQKLLGEHLLAGCDLIELRVRAQARFGRIDEAVVVLIAGVLDLLGDSRITEKRAKPERQGSAVDPNSSFMAAFSRSICSLARSPQQRAASLGTQNGSGLARFP
jgi:hypothetical protein